MDLNMSETLFENEYFRITLNSEASLVIEDLTQGGTVNIDCMCGGLGVSTDIFHNTMNLSGKNNVPVVLVKKR